MEDLGKIGEGLARRVYESRGFSILAQNFYNRRGRRMGEIDFVAVKDGDIRFVEVKTRSAGRLESALWAVDYRKQLKMLKAADYFLLRFPEYQKYRPHVDVVAVIFGSVDKRRIIVKIYSDGIGAIC
ncbi:YraN family protein [Patescibacteria group bacterium]|nr:YraN family protein [Patescibacteria group bacterium]